MSLQTLSEKEIISTLQKEMDKIKVSSESVFDGDVIFSHLPIAQNYHYNSCYYTIFYRKIQYIFDDKTVGKTPCFQQN